MHADQLTISVPTVRVLVDEQFPAWRGLRITALRAPGTVNAIFRIGNQLAARFPLQPGPVWAVRSGLEREAAAARDLAGRTRFRTPEPVALGKPGAGYPLPWAVQSWLSGVSATDDDPGESAGFARDLAEFITGVRAIDTRGRMFSGSGRGGDLRAHDAWMETCFARSGSLLDVPRLRGMWQVLRDLPRGPGPDVMNHGDLIPGNVLVSGGRLLGSSTSVGWGRRIRRWIWWPPGTCSAPDRGRCSGTSSAAVGWTGRAARPGRSSRRWGWCGTTPTAIR